MLLFVLFNGFKQQLKAHLSEEKAGFRKSRSTIHQSVTLRLIAEKTKRQRKKIYNYLIDLHKTFDTVKQTVIWTMVRSRGVEEKMMTLLQKIYEKAQSAVLRIKKSQGAWFRTAIGARWGDLLLPLLIIVHHERVMDHRKESKCGIDISETILNNLRFADDIDLINEECGSRRK